MAKFIYKLSIITTAVITYLYLDWSILQIIGVAFLLTLIHEASKKKPTWQRVFFLILGFSLLVLGHFFINDNIMHWGALLLAVLLFFVSIDLLNKLFNHKPGDGSLLTMYFLGIIFFLPTATYILYKGMKGLGYW